MYVGEAGWELWSILALCLCKFVHFIIRGELRRLGGAVNTFPEQRLIFMLNMGHSKRHMLQYTGNARNIL